MIFDIFALILYNYLVIFIDLGGKNFEYYDNRLRPLGLVFNLVF